jgi:hypothetical protein
MVSVKSIPPAIAVEGIRLIVEASAAIATRAPAQARARGRITEIQRFRKCELNI